MAEAKKGPAILEAAHPGDNQFKGVVEQVVRTARTHCQTYLAALVMKFRVEDMSIGMHIFPWGIRPGAWC